MKRALLLLVLVLAGCGKVTTVREPDVIVSNGDAVPTRTAPDQQSRGVRIATARIVFVTHGQASDPFWSVVKRGYQDAAKQTGAAVSYRAPDSFSIETMKRYIDVAIADHPDGLVVSLPDVKALTPSIEKAVKAGIPVITINSGADEFKSLGVLAHVGQPEYAAGVKSGERLAAAGVRSALCVNQESGQQRARRALPRVARRAQQGRRERPRARHPAAGPGDRAAADGGGAHQRRDRRHPHARPRRHGAGDRRHQRQRA